MDIVGAPFANSVNAQQMIVNTVVATATLVLRIACLSPNPATSPRLDRWSTRTRRSVFIRVRPWLVLIGVHPWPLLICGYEGQLRHPPTAPPDCDGGAPPHELAMNVAERNWPPQRQRIPCTRNRADLTVARGDL